MAAVAAEVLVDPLLPVGKLLPGFFVPVPVGRPPRLHGAGTAFKETGHPGGEEFLVGVGGDLVGGVGPVVAVGDDAAH